MLVVMTKIKLFDENFSPRRGGGIEKKMGEKDWKRREIEEEEEELGRMGDGDWKRREERGRGIGENMGEKDWKRREEEEDELGK